MAAEKWVKADTNADMFVSRFVRTYNRYIYRTYIIVWKHFKRFAQKRTVDFKQ